MLIFFNLLSLVIIFSGCQAAINDNGQVITDDTVLPTASTSSSLASGSSSSGVNGGATCDSMTLTVEAKYSNAPNWMDYGRQTVATGEVSNTACVGYDATGVTGENGTTLTCVHGGPLRKVETIKTTCDDLILTDNLGVFDWWCEVSGGVAVFTSRLKETKGLKDLIESTGGDGAGFYDNYVTLTDGTCSWLSTAAKWWTNDIYEFPDNSAGSVLNLDGNNDGGNDAVLKSGDILILSANQESKGYNLNLDKLALVTMGDVVLTSNIDASNCNSSTGEIASANVKCLLSSGYQNFLWVEGNYNGLNGATTAYSVIHSRSTYFSRYRNLNIARGATGIKTISTSFNKYENINISNITSSPVSIWGNNNTFYNFITSANGNFFQGSVNNSNNTFVRFTLGNSYNHGFSINGTSDTLHNFLFGNIQSYSLTSVGINTNYSQIAIPKAWRGIYIGGASTGNHFTGNLIIDNTSANLDCVIDDAATGEHPGLSDAGNTYVCTATDTSDFNLINTIASYTPFIGKITADDTSNGSDNSGSLVFDSITDWHNFTNFYRAWGQDGTAYPNTDHDEDCITGETCRIWDWGLSSSDTIVRNTSGDGVNPNDTFEAGETCPDQVIGDNETLTSNVLLLLDNASYPYFKSSVEIISDGVGDDDGLCESNEHCLYTPNFGSYQGHGDLSECTFVDGGSISDPKITGVRMWGYTNNGR